MSPLGEGRATAAAIIDPDTVDWPRPWRPIREAARFFPGALYPGESVLAELRREICERHPLFGVECVPLAYDSGTAKDFLFATARPEMPFVTVHFTGRIEHEPNWPVIVAYPTLDAFLQSGRDQQT